MPLLLKQARANPTARESYIEELIHKEAPTIVVLDPHADYIYLSLTSAGGTHEFSRQGNGFPEFVEARAGPRRTSEGPPTDEVAFTDLHYMEICDLAGGDPENASNIRESVRLGLEEATQQGYTPPRNCSDIF